MNEMNESHPENLVKLHVMGISYNEIHNDVYALILAQDDGPYRLPVVIGAAEATSIIAFMQKISTPRPMTHDLFVNLGVAFGVKLRYVYIYKFESGIFSSELVFTDGEREVVFDARTSDAVAIAVRTDSPIYTTPEILHEVGFIMKDDKLSRPEDSDESGDSTDDFIIPDVSGEKSEPLSEVAEGLSVSALEEMLERYIKEEEYERAAKISELIKRKRESGE